MPRDIHAVTVRHYDGSFGDIQEVQRYLTSVLRSEKGSVTTRPSSSGQFGSGDKGRLLIWRPGRLVYQDPGLKWWFDYGW